MTGSCTDTAATFRHLQLVVLPGAKKEAGGDEEDGGLFAPRVAVPEDEHAEEHVGDEAGLEKIETKSCDKHWYIFRH